MYIKKNTSTLKWSLNLHHYIPVLIGLGIVLFLGFLIATQDQKFSYLLIGVIFLASTIALFLKKYALLITLVLISSVIPEQIILLGSFKLTLDTFFLIFAVSLWYLREVGREKKSFLLIMKTGSSTIPMIAFAVIVILSITQSNYLDISIVNGVRMVFWHLVWINIMVLYINSEKRLMDTTKILLVTIGVFSLLSLIELLINSSSNSILTNRLAGSFMGLSIGKYLGVATIILFSTFIYANNFKMKLKYLVFCVLLLVLLFLAQSRMAFVAMLFGLMGSIFVLPKSKKIKWLFVGMGLLVLILVIFVVPENARYHSLLDLQAFKLSTKSEDYSVWTRATLWSRAIDISQQNLLLGVGIGTGIYELGLNFGREALLDVHNLYLSVLLETGVLGLLFFLWFLWSIWFGLYRSNKISISSKNLKILLTAMFGVMTFIIIEGITGGYLKGGDGTFISSLLALGIASINISKESIKNE